MTDKEEGGNGEQDDISFLRTVFLKTNFLNVLFIYFSLIFLDTLNLSNSNILVYFMQYFSGIELFNS